MRIIEHPLLKVLLLLILPIFIGIFLRVRYEKPKSIQQNNLVDKQEAITSQNTEVHSPDGTMKIIMRAKIGEGHLKNYSFFVLDISGKNEKSLFTKTAGAQEEMSLPLNSFSPDNKYLYLEENKPNILVFKTSGETFVNGEQYLDVGQLLAKSKAEYRINHVTGWVSPTLVQILTVADNSTKGPSYWFDVESHAFLQQ